MESHTPKGKHRRPMWNTLNVNSLKVRCFSPVVCDIRSPNLSPIGNLRTPKMSVSKMIYKKSLLNNQQQKQPPSDLRLSVKKAEDSNCSLENISDELNDSSMDNSLCKESRLNSLQASNHSYVINHASSVQELLLLAGLESYLKNFEEADIDFVDLVSMKRIDLKRLGLRKDEDCNRILNALKQL